MRGARVESGSPGFIPRITGKEYLRFCGNSIRVPPASIRKIRGPTRANATGLRSWISTFRRLGTKRITLADSTHGICSSCAFCWASGMKKMLRPMSAPITSMICALVTFCMPVTSMLSLDSTRKRHERSPYSYKPAAAIGRAHRTAAATEAHSRRLAVFLGSELRRAETRFCPRRKGDSSSTSRSISRASSSSGSWSPPRADSA